MIKYPDSDRPDKPIPPSIEVKPIIVTDSLQELFKNGNITVGTKVIFPENSATCVNAFNDIYIFSYDQAFTLNNYSQYTIIPEDIKDNLYETLRLFANNTIYVPEKIKKEIDFFFIPTATQIFSEEELKKLEKECNIDFELDETTQFEYYKDSYINRLKEDNDSGMVTDYILSTITKPKNPIQGFQEYYNVACSTSGKIFSNHRCQKVAICFQITKKQEE